ncbi:hypothetical protein BSZ35_18770 [Salinibacter sp. 10B]|uniref:hypothetical protein n=1 Tax=Salinibacter sp. 10B TaxID=1923971 RepID=UPI000CF472F9|nr:hypothetical protein [Salinibacter sp. 10B]PQJ26963.1 hypothetical protein BSZ35_18770 [Salinibacter sp. 10B]
MALTFTTTARRFGIVSAGSVAVLQVAYAATLITGFVSLESPEEPIGDPMFTILEVLILAMMPALVALMVSVHAWAAPRAKVWSLASVIFMGLVAGVTSTLHFLILTLSRQPAFGEVSNLPLFLSFEWPSVAYALDILAWDVFFALSVLFAAPVFGGSRLATSIRVLMITSGLLGFAGLGGVLTGDMDLRNVGIVGYLGVLLIVAVLLGVLFYRTKPADVSTDYALQPSQRGT